MTSPNKMETDNVSETQSQILQTELVWDHSGDVESEPLLGHSDNDRSNNGIRPSNVQLTYNQAQALLEVLNNTRFVLETYIGHEEATYSPTSEGWSASWWSNNCFPARRRKIANHIFIITIGLQAINLLVVSLIDLTPKEDDDKPVIIGSGVTMVLLQVINLFFIILVSSRLVRQVLKHRVSFLLLCQSYLSTILLFAGIYTLTYRMAHYSWKFIEEDGLDHDPVLVIVLYSKFLFFSVSTATLCGSDNVLPKEWYNCLFTASQMLLSFVYFASILGQTMKKDASHWLGTRPQNSSYGATEHSPMLNAVVSNHVTSNHGREPRTTRNTYTDNQSVNITIDEPQPFSINNDDIEYQEPFSPSALTK